MNSGVLKNNLPCIELDDLNYLIFSPHKRMFIKFPKILVNNNRFLSLIPISNHASSSPVNESYIARTYAL